MSVVAKRLESATVWPQLTRAVVYTDAGVRKQQTWGGAVPLSVGRADIGAEAYLRTKWRLDPSNRLTNTLTLLRQTDRTGQRSDGIGPGRPFYKWSPKNGFSWKPSDDFDW